MSAETSAWQVVSDFVWHGDTSNPGVPPAANRLADLAALRAAVEEQIAWAVAQRELDGLTWQQIADALGVSRQAAHGRYSRRSKEM